jgi:hypothetical protein
MALFENIRTHHRAHFTHLQRTLGAIAATATAILIYCTSSIFWLAFCAFPGSFKVFSLRVGPVMAVTAVMAIHCLVWWAVLASSTTAQAVSGTSATKATPKVEEESFMASSGARKEDIDFGSLSAMLFMILSTLFLLYVFVRNHYRTMAALEARNHDNLTVASEMSQHDDDEDLKAAVTRQATVATAIPSNIHTSTMTMPATVAATENDDDGTLRQSQSMADESV